MTTREESEFTYSEIGGSTKRDETCVFCQIVNGQMDAEILFCDEELSCFRDINPGARHHYLVVPNKHIENCTLLRNDHIRLVEKMVEVGETVLRRETNDFNDSRLGFHIPPFISVPHLHLHVLAPASKMDPWALYKYGPQSFWIVTADKVLQQLRCKGHVR